MKILVDEHIPLMTVKALREAKHEVRDIRGTAEEGMADAALWKHAQREGRLLISCDTGFTQYRAAAHYGILIIRLRKPNRKRIHARIMDAIHQVPPREWPGLLMVMRDVAQSTWRARRRE
jgi:predicted nuclease of predicted toxin-antitoxin system